GVDARFDPVTQVTPTLNRISVVVLRFIWIEGRCARYSEWVVATAMFCLQNLITPLRQLAGMTHGVPLQPHADNRVSCGTGEAPNVVLIGIVVGQGAEPNVGI